MPKHGFEPWIFALPSWIQVRRLTTWPFRLWICDVLLMMIKIYHYIYSFTTDYFYQVWGSRLCLTPRMAHATWMVTLIPARPRNHIRRQLQKMVQMPCLTDEHLLYFYFLDSLSPSDSSFHSA